MDHRKGDQSGHSMEGGELHLPFLDPSLQGLHRLIVRPHGLLQGFRLLSKQGSDIELLDAVPEALVRIF